MIARLLFAGFTAVVLIVFAIAMFFTRTPEGNAVGVGYLAFAWIVLVRARHPERESDEWSHTRATSESIYADSERSEP